MTGRVEVRPVGRVESALRRLDDAPKQAGEGAPEAVLAIEPEYADAVLDLAPGDRIVVLTWLHLADRDVLAVRPRGDEGRPVTGVFSTRSPARPNPVGLHEVEVLEVEVPAAAPARIRVAGLEAVDGTPVVDIKPVRGGSGRAGHAGRPGDPDHLVAVLGRGVLDPDAPAVTADDLGLTRGDGCFDSARVVTDERGAARVVDLGTHLERLSRSAAAMDLDAPRPAEWERLVDDALAAWSTPGEAVLKLVLTRGREWRDAGPTAFLTLTHRPPARRPRSVTAVTLGSGRPSTAHVDAPWLLGGVKTLSYVVNAAATREARRRGADEVIFTTTDGFALEGPTSALLVARGGTLLATPTGGTGILESVTIRAIAEAARAEGVALRYELVTVEDLHSADGVWLVSSGRGPVLVTTLDDRALGADPDLDARVRRWAGF